MTLYRLDKPPFPPVVLLPDLVPAIHSAANRASPKTTQARPRGVSKHRNFGPKALDLWEMGGKLGKLVPLARFIHMERSKNRGLWLPVLKHYVT